MTDFDALPAIELTRIEKTFHRGATPVRALDAVSLRIEQGEFFGLLGPNGAGKSTLINALGGLLRLDGGNVRILGCDLANDPIGAKMAIGIVPQEITFDPFFTVRETLALQSGYYGIDDNTAWIEEVCERLGLKDKLDDRVMRLSGGMKRRVLIAQALMHRPPVIVLDEPTAGVDIELRQRLWNFMKELNANGHTIILTTHYLEEAQALCSRIALVHRGRIVAQDDTQSLLARHSAPHVTFHVTEGDVPERFPFALEALGNDTWRAAYRSPRELSALMQALLAAGVIVDRVDTGSADLHDVFLALTQS